MARMIATAIQRGGIVCTYDEKGQTLFSVSAGGQYASDGLQGYTPSTVSVRRGGIVYTYNAKGQSIQSHSAGPPTPKNKPAPPRNNAIAPYAKSKSVPVPAQRNRFPAEQVQQAIPVRTNPRYVTHNYDTEDTEDAEDTEELPDWVRDAVLISDRYRRRWKRLAIAFMILFSLLLSLMVLALAIS
jgi:hypothetical protein